MTDKLKILEVASEVAPYAKTGGLADVTGSLPEALRARGHDVRVVLPHYRTVSLDGSAVQVMGEALQIPVDGQLVEGRLQGLGGSNAGKVLFIADGGMFDRDQLYGDSQGDYGDNDRRFSFFSRAALEACKRMDFQPDIIHCHDWQAGLIPAYLKTVYGQDPFFRNTATVFTIHNVGYQGVFGPDAVRVAGLPYDRVFHVDGMEYYGQVSFLKAGIVYAEVVNTVSRKYAEEIQTPEYGFGMDGILHHRRDSLFGIVNGADYETWDPRRDAALPVKFGPGAMDGKADVKAALLNEAGLPADLAKKPLIGMVTRLSGQKGLDLVAEIFPRLMKKQVGFVLLGTGEQHLQDAFAGFSEKFQKKAAVQLKFDDGLAHRIIAGSDFFLQPSRYEPCGLTQIYSMRYGTVPIVRATGGLDDTVKPWDAKAGTGTGFVFNEFSGDALIGAIEAALKTYRAKKQMAKLQENGMAADYSWDGSAEKYEELFQKAIYRLP